MQNIFYDKKKGIFAILILFTFAFAALIAVPKIFSNVFSLLEKREKSTIAVDLSKEEQDRIRVEISDLEKSLNTDPALEGEGLAKIHRDIAQRYAQLGRLGTAISYYDKALTANRLDTASLVEKGKLLGAMDALSEGEETLKKAIELEPTKGPHYSALAAYYQKFGSDIEKARGTYIEGLVRTNNDTTLMREFASFLESVGETSEAYLYWVELGKKLPKDEIVQERTKALEPK